MAILWDDVGEYAGHGDYFSMWIAMRDIRGYQIDMRTCT